MYIIATLESIQKAVFPKNVNRNARKLQNAIFDNEIIMKKVEPFLKNIEDVFKFSMELEINWKFLKVLNLLGVRNWSEIFNSKNEKLKNQFAHIMKINVNKISEKFGKYKGFINVDNSDIMDKYYKYIMDLILSANLILHLSEYLLKLPLNNEDTKQIVEIIDGKMEIIIKIVEKSKYLNKEADWYLNAIQGKSGIVDKEFLTLLRENSIRYAKLYKNLA